MTCEVSTLPATTAAGQRGESQPEHLAGEPGLPHAGHGAVVSSVSRPASSTTKGSVTLTRSFRPSAYSTTR